jgi:Spy/CpxP family protein refolding chaperone
MLGFIIGTICLVAFIGVYKRGYYHRRVSHWWFLRKLDTSPAQERVIRNAFGSVRQLIRNFANDSHGSRRELAELLRASDFDRQGVSDWFAGREAELKQLRETTVEALGEVYEVLDDQQRETLARLVERGRLGSACSGRPPYRSHAAEAP